MTIAARFGDVVRQAAIVLIELLAILTELNKHVTRGIVTVVKAGLDVWVLAADQLDVVLDTTTGALEKKE